MKFLVVEDDFTSRKILQKLLQKHGEVDVAVDGHEALEAFAVACEEDRTISGSHKYDVIFLDINMPNLDGQETLKAIRSIEADLGIQQIDGVKIVMATGVGDKESILAAFREGCEAYIKKPYSKAEILDKLIELGLESR